MTEQDPITRLQEDQLFLDRRLDELNEAILAMSERLDRVVRTMAQLEQRLDALRDAEVESADDDAADPFDSSRDAP